MCSPKSSSSYCVIETPDTCRRNIDTDTESSTDDDEENLNDEPKSIPQEQADLILGTKSKTDAAEPNMSRSKYPPGVGSIQMNSSTHSQGSEAISLRMMCHSTKPMANHLLEEDSDEEIDHTEQVKTKLLSVWNNLKYGWKTRTGTNFKYDTAIWVLGKCYHIKKEEDISEHQTRDRAVLGVSRQLWHQPKQPSQKHDLDNFKRDFGSRLWMTYRKLFPQIPGTSVTSDCGWGCMLRSGQMILAESLSRHFLGRNWNIYQEHRGSETLIWYRKIIRLFGDQLSTASPFSIHQLVQLGERSGKKAGDWYGPSSVSYVLQSAMHEAALTHPELSNLCIYVSQDCTVYKKDVFDLCVSSNEGGAAIGGGWKSLIVLVPVRLGSSHVNPIYASIKDLLTLKSSIGIVGGRPRHSLYFVGYQDEKLIYLDPHYCQDTIDVNKPNFPIQSFCCMSPRKVSFNKMDPSCTIGFYCRTEEDFIQFCTQSKEVLTTTEERNRYPVFTFNDGNATDYYPREPCPKNSFDSPKKRTVSNTVPQHNPFQSSSLPYSPHHVNTTTSEPGDFVLL